jgi:hypothetical protein
MTSGADSYGTRARAGRETGLHTSGQYVDPKTETLTIVFADALWRPRNARAPDKEWGK